MVALCNIIRLRYNEKKPAGNHYQQAFLFSVRYPFVLQAYTLTQTCLLTVFPCNLLTLQHLCLVQKAEYTTLRVL